MSRDPRRETEKGFQAAVVEYAQLHGWRVHHARPARTKKGWRTPIMGDAGFPDLVLAREDRVLFRELKSDGGKRSDDQKVWGGILLAAGADYAVWRPDDWSLIERKLERGGGA